jgi:hypothetical protein
MKSVIYIGLAFLFACNSSGSEKEHDDLVTIENRNNLNQDSLAEIAEDAADKMRDEQALLDVKSKGIAKVVATQDLGWQADKNLNAVRVLAITNNSERGIIGVFLKSEVKSGDNITDTRNFGKFKFKVPLAAHKSKIIKIPANRIGRDSETVLNSNSPSWAGLIIKETLLVRTVIFDDGSFSSVND